MSDAIKQISEAINQRIQVVLPDYKKLDYVYHPEKNNFYNNFKRFGNSVGSAATTTTITKAISFNQAFNVLLTESYKATDLDEANLVTRIYELQDSMERIYLDLYKTNLGLNQLVFQVAPLTIDAPLIVETQQIIILTMSLNVQYRISLI